MNITVYLGANEGNDYRLGEAVRELGDWIGTSGHVLVYGGSKSGLMGELAESVIEAGGEATGVEPQFFIDAAVQYEKLTELIVTKNIEERKAKMIELGHRKQKAYEEKLLGTTQEVLMEEAVETEDGIYQVGHTKEYVKIGLKTEENLSNQLKNVKIEDTKQIIH